MRRHVMGTFAALAVLAAACNKAEPAPPAPNVVLIAATEFAYAAPDTVPAGWTRLRLANNGQQLHHVQLIRITDGRTYDSLMAAMRNPGPPPTWVKEIGSPNAPGQGDTTEVISNLEVGHYALVCFIPDSLGRPHVALGMIRPIEVVAATGTTAAEPTADVEINLTDYAFTESAPLTAGTHLIKITNAGPQTHEIFFAKLDSGVTAEGLVRWVKAGMKGRPLAMPAGGTVGITVGGHAYLPITFTPGNYAVLCFIPDSGDGREHVDHGMLKQITIN